MNSSSVLALLLLCVAASVRSFRVRQVDVECPPNPAIVLESCLNTLEGALVSRFFPENCRPAMEALKCTMELIRLCGDASGLLDVLAKHDPMAAWQTIQPFCLRK